MNSFKKMSNGFDQYFERKMKTLFVRLDVDKNLKQNFRIFSIGTSY